MYNSEEFRKENLKLIKILGEGIRGLTNAVFSLWKQKSKSKFQLLKIMYDQHSLGVEWVRAKELERLYRPLRTLKRSGRSDVESFRRGDRPQIYRSLNKCINEKLVEKRENRGRTQYRLTEFGKIIMGLCILLEVRERLGTEVFERIFEEFFIMFREEFERLAKLLSSSGDAETKIIIPLSCLILYLIVPLLLSLLMC